MKLLTLNTHSLLEEGYQQKMEWFVEMVAGERPDIVALQEVNQSVSARPAGKALLEGAYVAQEGECLQGTGVIREDNHAAQAAFRLREAGIACWWAWVPAKIGYGKYDEGLAFLCLGRRITAAESFFISGCREYGNWKTRKALGIQAEGSGQWFYSVHMGWWKDEEEPFESQWKRLEGAVQDKKEKAPVWLMGDFNSPAEFRGQGYDCIRDAGWFDSYCLAEKKDSGITVEGCIDGWRPERPGQAMPGGMRMDHIWCSRAVPVQESKAVFNGENGRKVSDHYGVMVEF